jgi:PHP family Zn ribbon phosphoesterase
VEFLADRKEPENVPKFYNHVPLVEMVSQSLGRRPTDSLVQNVYHRFVTQAGNEFKLLYALSEESLAGIVSEKVLEAVMKVRKGTVEVIPGYDGVYGEVKLWDENHSQKQRELFG